MDVLALVLFLGPVVLFLVRAWKGRGRLSATDRWTLVTGFVWAATAFVAAPLLVNWVVVPAAVWLLAVAVLAGGVVGAVLRCPELAWCAGTRPVRRAVGVGTTLVSCALVIGVAVS